MNPNQCKETVADDTGFHFYQCSRKPVKDGYCKQHHPDSVAERRRKAEEKYEAERKKSAWYQLSEARETIEIMQSVIDRLNAEVEELKEALILGGSR